MNNRYFFMVPLLERLAQPAFFCWLVAMTLRVAAALVALLSFTIFFQVGKLTFELPANRVLGGFLFEVFFVLAVYAAVHVFLIRAREVENVRSGDTYAIAVLALLVRLAGEAYFAFVTLMAIGGGLFVWFTSRGLDDILGPVVRVLLPGSGDDSTFMGGIQLMMSGVLSGLGVLVLSYAGAQALAILLRSGRNGSAQQFPTANLTQSYRSRFGAGS